MKDYNNNNYLFYKIIIINNIININISIIIKYIKNKDI